MITIKMWVIGIGTLGFLFVIYLGYVHYTGLLEDNTTLKDNNSKVQLALNTQKGANKQSKEIIEEWKQHSDTLIESIKEMQSQAEIAQSENRRLNDIFLKYDIKRMALSDPDLVQYHINDGSDRINRLFRCETSEGGCSDAEFRSSIPDAGAAESGNVEPIRSKVDGGDP